MRSYRQSPALHKRLTTPEKPSEAPEWRCTGCGRLLGLIRKNQLHLRLRRGHEYLASLPATASCRGCGTMNTL